MKTPSLQFLSHGILFADVTGVELRWKSADPKAVSYFKTSLEGKTPHEVFGKDSGDLFMKEYKSLLESKEERAFEMKLGKGKSVKIIRTTLVPFIDDSFNINHVACHLDEAVQKQGEDELVTSMPQQQERAFDVLSDAVWDWNVKTGAFRWMGRIDALLGYSEAEVPQSRETWQYRIHPDDVGRVTVALEKHLAGNASYDEVYRLKKKDGSYLICRDRGSALRNSKGDVTSMFGTLTDITEKMTKEDALIQRVEKYSNLIESSSDIIVECDLHGKIRSVNPKGASHFGLTPEKMKNRWLDDFFYFHDGKEFDQWRESVTTKPRSNIELRTLRSGRLHAYVTCSTHPEWSESHVPTGFLFVAKDNSLQRQSLQEYKAIFESSRDGIILFQHEKILRVNKAAARQFGVGDQNYFVRRSVYELVPSSQREEAAMYFTPQFDGDDPTLYPALRGLRTDGTQFDLEISISVLSYEDEPIFMLITRDVTERKVAIALLKQSESFFRALIEHSPDFIILTTMHGSTMYVNPAFTHLLGYDPSHLGDRNPLTLVHPKDRRKCIRAIVTVLQTKDPVRVLCRVPSAHGEWIDFDALIVPLISSSGEIDQFFISARDVSISRKAEALIIQSEKRYRALFESAGDGLFVFNTKGTIVNVNQSGCTMLGYEVDELKGEDIRFMMYEDDVQHFVHDPYVYVADPLPEERRLRKKDGREMWVHWRTSAFEVDGELALLAIVTDITEERRLRGELEYEHAFNAAVIQSLEPLRVINLDTWEVVSVNPKAEEYFSLASTTGSAFISCNQIGHKNVSCIDPDCPIHLAITHAAPVPVERRIESEDRWLWLCGYPFTVSNHQYIAEMIRDITDQKKMEASLAHAQKMDAIGTLAGGIAHDFNNLLGGIIGFTSLAKLKLDTKHNLYKAIDSIEKSAQRAAKLTEQLLDFARAGRVQVENIMLNTVVDSVLNLVERTFQKKIAIEKHIAPDLWFIEGDTGQIEHSVLNLCINARDAIAANSLAENGVLEIYTENKIIESDFLDLPPDFQPGSYVCLSVKDNGIGMDADVRARIFEPFFTTKADNKGTGLGLAMVYGIMQAHNGYIDVESEPGKGSTFTLYFPAVSAPEQPVRTSSVQEFVNGSGIVILADDEELMRNAAQEILEALGYRVLVAADGKEVLELFEKTPKVLCVILDVMMPGMSGTEVYSHLRKKNPNLRVLFTSGYYPDPRAKKFIESGEVDFLQKPYTVEALAEKLAEVVAK